MNKFKVWYHDIRKSDDHVFLGPLVRHMFVLMKQPEWQSIDVFFLN